MKSPGLCNDFVTLANIRDEIPMEFVRFHFFDINIERTLTSISHSFKHI